MCSVDTEFHCSLSCLTVSVVRVELSGPGTWQRCVCGGRTRSRREPLSSSSVERRSRERPLSPHPLASERPKAEEATPILAHILDVGFAAADSIKVAGVEIRLCERSGVLDLLAVVQVRGEPLTQADDEIRARVFEEGVGRRTAEAGSESFAAVKIAIEGESAIVSIDTSPTARSSPAKQHATQPARSSPLAG